VLKRFPKRLDELHTFHAYAVLSAIFSASLCTAADFHPPAGEHYALVGASGTVLPGGRLLKPYGIQIETGPGPFGLAVSPRGTVATADIGYERFGVTIIEPPGKNPVLIKDWRARHIWARTPHSTAPELADPDWRGVTSGIVFDSEKSFWVSEGDSGRIRQVDVSTGDHRKVVSLNGPEWSQSFTGDLAYDGARHLLFVVDQSNARVAVVDARNGRVVSSIRLDKKPFAIALSPDGLTAYVTETDAVCVIDVRDAVKPAMAERIPSASPQAVLAAADRVFVSNARDDSITVISAGDRRVVGEIQLRIPSLEEFRGVVPAGLAYDPVTKWLLVAESGINAVGVVDTATNQLIGHIPAGWTPTRVAIAGDRVYVTNARGRGTGPNPRRVILELGEVPVLHRGSVSTFILPDINEIFRQTGEVFAFNGFVPYMREAPRPAAVIGHVVLIVKEGRTFDEVLGDVAANAASMAKLAFFGMHGLASGGSKQFSVKDAAITPNQHEIARRWAFSDNFYTDGETKAEGELWLDGGYPDALTDSGILAHGGSRAADANISDQQRADQFIAEIERRYVKGGEPLPRLLRVHLPNDRTSGARPQDGYPYEVSFALDNDFAAGRIVDYFSHSPWWRDMAIFITETDTQGGLDHVDAHRTLLFAAGPYAKRNYVSHTNSSFPGLLRTIHEFLGLPAGNLMDKTAASLRDMFTGEADFGTFEAVEPDKRIFDPGKVRAK
jgi:YVTN family beta-propeller protein